MRFRFGSAHIFIVLLALAAGGTAAGAVQKRCHEWVSPDVPIMERSHRFRGVDGQPVDLGPALATPSYYWNRGVWFEMPLGYLNPWPSSPETIIDKDRFKEAMAKIPYKGFDPVTGDFNPELITSGGVDYSFAFWMPSLRYVERNKWTTPHHRPCEAGRPPPTDDEYTVSFRIEWPFLPGSGESDDASKFRVAAASLARGEPLIMQRMSREEHSLDGPISGMKGYQIYSDDGDLVVQLNCSAYEGKEAPPNPTCGGQAWQRSSDLILFLFFASDMGQQGLEERWRAPVEAAISLAKKWRQ